MKKNVMNFLHAKKFSFVMVSSIYRYLEHCNCRIDKIILLFLQIKNKYNWFINSRPLYKL